LDPAQSYSEVDDAQYELPDYRVAGAMRLSDMSDNRLYLQ